MRHPAGVRASGDFKAVARAFLRAVGEDTKREGLQRTPERYQKACMEWFGGYFANAEEVLTSFADGASDVDEMVVQTDIPVWSHCEHHFAPFFGTAAIGYIPTGKVVGLSKLHRLVDVFGRRLQVQERLTQQIATALVRHLAPSVAVVIKCRHFCIESRGVHNVGSETTTSAMYGSFRTNVSARAEFLSLIRG